MANKHRGFSELEIAGGRKLKLKATWDVLGELQDDLGCESFFDVPNVVIEVATGRRNPRCIADFIYRMAVAAGEDIGSREDAARLELADPISTPAVIIEAFKAGGWIKLEPVADAEAGNAQSPPKKKRANATA